MTKITEMSPQDIADLRDKYEWRASMEFRINGDTPKFRALVRSFRVLSAEVAE